MTGCYLETVFSVQGKLDYKPWVEIVCKKTNWLFSASTLRKKVFELASIDYNLK